MGWGVSGGPGRAPQHPPGCPQTKTYVVLVDVLPVQGLCHLHPARLLLDGEDALGGGICTLPCDAVEDLGVSVPVGFDLGGDTSEGVGSVSPTPPHPAPMQWGGTPSTDPLPRLPSLIPEPAFWGRGLSHFQEP